MNQRALSVLYMFAITLFFTCLVTVVKAVNDEKIQTNQQVKLQKVVLKVLNIPVPADASDLDIVRLFESKVQKGEFQGRVVYTSYDETGKIPQSHALGISGPGFWGPIYAMVAVDANVSRIIGIEFFQHQETPGLGARITEPRFEQQFAGLPVSLAPGDKAFFSLTPPAPKKTARELDAITGATQTSRAVDAFLNREMFFIKEFQQRRAKR